MWASENRSARCARLPAMSSTPLQDPIRAVSSLFSSEPRVDHLARLVGLRWVAIAGQFSAVIAAERLGGLDLPMTPLLLIIALLAAFNLFSQAFGDILRRMAGSDERLMLAELLVDMLALTLLLYWSGGADNPFPSLILLQLSIGAAVLPAAYVGALLLVSVAAFAGLHRFKVPLQWPPETMRHELELVGLALSFLLTAGLIALFVTRMTASLRERDRLLALQRENTLRDQQIVALGTLATGALHELGTPLSTIKVLVGELLDTTRDASILDDLRLIANQVDACKGTLSKLAAQTGAARGERLRAQRLSSWLDDAVARWRALQPRTEVRWHADAALAGVEVAVDETLGQALLNLLNNAAQFSPARVDARARLVGDALEVEIRDYGPGMPQAIAALAGRAPRSTRDGGLGLGLFLAHATIERFGGSIALDNHADGGLLTRMVVPLSRWRV